MTNKEFFANVISANLSDEMTEKAQAMLDQLTKEREKASARVNSKKLAENAPILNAIRNLMHDGKKRLTSEVAVELELSTPKASALLRQLVALEELSVEDIKVKGKGVQKCYVARFADTDAEYMRGVSPLFFFGGFLTYYRLGFEVFSEIII